MPRTLEHSFKVLVLRELMRNGSWMPEDQLRGQFCIEDQGKVTIAIDRLLEVKFIIKSNSMGRIVFGYTREGASAYEIYDGDLAI